MIRVKRNFSLPSYGRFAETTKFLKSLEIPSVFSYNKIKNINCGRAKLVGASFTPKMGVQALSTIALTDCTIFLIFTMLFFFQEETTRNGFWCFILIEARSGGVELYTQHRILCFQHLLW